MGKKNIDNQHNPSVMKRIIYISTLAVMFVLGFVTSSLIKNNPGKISANQPVFAQPVTNLAGNTTVTQVITPMSNMPVMTPVMQPTLSPEHQEHISVMAKKATEAAKTGDYSYLFSPIDDIKEEIPKVDIAEAKFLFDSGKAVFVDARGPAEYEQGHIKDSVNVPNTATPEEIVKLKDRIAGKVLVTYCHGTGCHLADKSAIKLFEAGYRKIAIFWGGWPKWNEHKYPVELKK